MDKTTSITRSNWTVDVGDERLSEASKPSVPLAQPTSLLNRQNDETPTSTTTTLPASALSNWSDIARSGISLKLFDRVLKIALQPAGWGGPHSRPMRAASLKQFLAFWETIKDVSVEPELALTSDGSLQAEWFKSNRQRLDLTFVEPKIYFGLFAPNSIVEGADDISTVAFLLKSHRAKPLLWSPK